MSAVDLGVAIKPGARFQQIVRTPKGVELTRVIEILSKPTPSMPATYEVIRNDAHPHRVGKRASIRRSDLERKYYPV